MEEYQDNSTVSPAISGVFVFHTAHAHKPFHYTGHDSQTSSLPATATASAFHSPILCSKLLPTSKWLPKWNGFSNSAKPVDKSQSLPKSNTNFKPLQSLWAQPSHIDQEKSIPNTMESFQQPELTKELHINQPIQKNKSRRLAQRRKQRFIKKESGKRHYTNIGLGRINRSKQYCLQNFGFFANPDHSITKNFKSALQTVPSQS
jgi:hypothetical protein